MEGLVTKLELKDNERKISRCRFCNSELTQNFLDLGMSPISNSFLKSEQLDKKEQFYPLHALVCKKCLLVQIDEFESPENIFSDYVYFSSYSETWLKHAENYVDMMISRFNFDENNRVIELASNDGYLLQFFKKQGIPILGIEPAKNVAKVAEQKGIPTITKFFGTQTADDLRKEGIQADLIIGNNVLAHVPNLNDFVSGMKIILKPDGIVTMEFPHLLQLIKQNQFDTIYHEHFSYFSLLSVQKIFQYHGFNIFDVEEIPTHGGSLRIYAKHKENDSLLIEQRVHDLEDKEERDGLRNMLFYESFQKRVDVARQNICNFFTIAKNSNKKIIGYGAPAKANTLLNYCKIGIDFIEYTVDLSPHKQGLYLPGTHIPIKNPDEINRTKPDYLVIFPWNLKEEIMNQMSKIRSWGGKFVVLIPEVEIY